jgi:hypothetical protein
MEVYMSREWSKVISITGRSDVPHELHGVCDRWFHERMKPAPSLYEWIGGMSALDRLADEFYKKVLEDDLLRPLFERMPSDHPHHVACFLRRCSAAHLSTPRWAATHACFRTTLRSI